MDFNIVTEIIIPICCYIGGLLFGFVFRMCWERRISRVTKYDEIVLNNEIDNIKEKLDVYWSIYFKLLICLTGKIQIKKLREMSTDLVNMIQMENDVIIKNLEDIVQIIIKNVQKMDMDDNLLDLILRFISHVLAYKCLRQINMCKKLPSEFGFPFPDEFTQEITRRTLLVQSKYEEYMGHKYDSEKFKGIEYLNMSLNNTETSNDINNNNNEPEMLRQKSRINADFYKKIDKLKREIPTVFVNINNNHIEPKNYQNKQVNQTDDDDTSVEIDLDDIDLENVLGSVMESVICKYDNEEIESPKVSAIESPKVSAIESPKVSAIESPKVSAIESILNFCNQQYNQQFEPAISSTNQSNNLNINSQTNDQTVINIKYIDLEKGDSLDMFNLSSDNKSKQIKQIKKSTDNDDFEESEDFVQNVFDTK
jgi:hypothetical protein